MSIAETIAETGISRDRLIKFEAGNLLLKTEEVIMLLDKMLITWDEFILMANNFEAYQAESVISGIRLAHAAQNVKELKRLYDEYSVVSRKTYQIVSIYIKQLIFAIEEEGEVTKAEKKIVSNYYQQLSVWTFLDKSLFTILFDVVEPKHKDNLITKFISSISIKHLDRNNINLIFSALANFFESYIEDNEKLNAEKILITMDKEFGELGNRSVREKVLIKFYRGILEVAYGDRELGTATCEHVIEIMEEFNFSRIDIQVKYLEKILNK
ncbi:MAG: hypothetical protein LBN08_05190 [Lactobacillales bacterium]|nr:hypothetical protein [Lactobacillales bacterium]